MWKEIVSSLSPSGRVLRTATAGGSARAADSAAFFCPAMRLIRRLQPQPTTPERSNCREHTFERRCAEFVLHIFFIVLVFGSITSHSPKRCLCRKSYVSALTEVRYIYMGAHTWQSATTRSSP